MIGNVAHFWAAVLFGYRPMRPCPHCGWKPRGDRSLARHLERQHPGRAA